jgi:Flp pilus assembly protein CpaB
VRRRPTLWWSATAALALATWSVVAGAVGDVEAGAARYGNPRAVLVATGPVGAGEVVDEDNTDVRPMPAALVPPGAAGPDDLGSRTTHPVHTGEVVHVGRLAPGGLSPIAALLPAGTRGLAIPGGAGGLALEVGDVVDVLATVEGLDEAAPTRTVAAGAVVVHVADEAVTVAVPVEQAPKVAYAVAAGIVTLALAG